MEAFDGFAAACHTLEGLLELREALDLNHDMELAEPASTEPQFASGQSPALDKACRFQMPHVLRALLAEFEVIDAGLEVAPPVIDIHGFPCRPANWFLCGIIDATPLENQTRKP